MNVQRDPDAILAAWLEEGPNALPEATRRAIAVNTRTTNQRRHPIWMPQRRPSMNIYARWAVAAIAIVVALGGAAYVLAPAGGGVGGPPTATASPIPSPSARASASEAPSAAALPSLSPPLLAFEGFVYPGTYVTRFDPPLTITVDKEVEHNCAPNFRCRGSIDVNLPGWLDLEFGEPRIEVLIGRLDKVFDPAHPKALIDPPADLAGWIAKVPGLTVVSPPTAVTVGGLEATQLDIRSGNKVVQFGPIPGVTDPGAFGFGANSTERVVLVRVDGHLVLIQMVGPEPFSVSMGELQPLVDSIVWN